MKELELNPELGAFYRQVKEEIGDPLDPVENLALYDAIKGKE
ncbi:MAG: hypothetical protein NTW86_07340 [Candidatus Sumerlaeota bacterium]|nr:hypothetical protein [Candidatus Sumerlaeota bacterium]